MKTISIRELHMNTGKWVRIAATSKETVVVSDRGRPTAHLSAIVKDEGVPFGQRSLVPGFKNLPPLSIDSAEILQEDRR